MVLSTEFAITRSIGVSHINVNDALIFCIEREDKTLYTEKMPGGNCVFSQLTDCIY